MKKPTPSDVKNLWEDGEQFFSRSAMRMFGQTMSSFKTEWVDKDKGIFRLFAPIIKDGKVTGESEVLFKVTNEGKTIEQIYKFELEGVLS